MFSFLTKEGVVALRLPAEVREQFMKYFETELCVQYGKVMKENFDLNFEYVSSLKPKPTK